MNILHVGLIKLSYSLCVRRGVCDKNNNHNIPESSFPCGSRYSQICGMQQCFCFACEYKSSATLPYKEVSVSNNP